MSSSSIGPGDVVQFKVGYTPPEYIDCYTNGGMMFTRGEIGVVESMQDEGLVIEDMNETPIPVEYVVRIGRASFWPDGSPVDPEV